MNIARILLFRLGLVGMIFLVVAGAKLATAETIQVGQYSAEVRGLIGTSRDIAGKSSLLQSDSSQITGLNSGLEGAGSELKADGAVLAKAITELKADVSETSIQVDLSADVLFDFDKSNIKPEADAALQKVVLIIASKRKGNVIITGHTDAKGSDSYNQQLSEKRAGSVRQWLIDRGELPGNVMVTMGMGESEPVAPNSNSDGSDNPEGRKLNRRVGIVIETK